MEARMVTQQENSLGRPTGQLIKGRMVSPTGDQGPDGGKNIRAKMQPQQFLLKNAMFQGSLKVDEYLGNFCMKISIHNLSRVSQSGYTEDYKVPTERMNLHIDGIMVSIDI